MVDEIADFDIDKASFFEFRDYVIELGYPANSSMYFKVPGLDFDGGLRRIESDKDVVALLEHYKDSEVLTIYVERGHEPLMVVSPKGKILLQNSFTCKGPLKQLPAAEVASASKKHCEEDYGADVEDETDDDQNQQHGHHDDSNVHHHPDIEDDHNQQHQLNDDSEVESEEQGFDPDEPPELHEDVEKPEDEDIFRGACEKEKQSHEAESVEEVQKTKQQVPVDENWITDDEDGDDFHSLCSSSDENNMNKWPEFNGVTDMENPQLKLGMTFSSPQVFRQALVE